MKGQSVINNDYKYKYELHGFNDTYVVKFVLKEILSKDKHPCGGLKFQKYTLYKGEVEAIFLAPPDASFNIKMLQQNIYFAVPSACSISFNTPIIATMYSGGQNDYLIINRVLTDISNLENTTFVNSAYAFSSGPMTCYQVGLINKLLLKLKIKHPDSAFFAHKRIKKDYFSKFLGK